MKHSILRSLIQSLDPSEHKRFRSYLESPYFNRNMRLVKLWEAFLSGEGVPPEGEMDLPRLFSLMYGPEQAYESQKVYDHCSFLLRHVEDFLAMQVWEADLPRQRIDSLHAMIAKKHEGGFHRMLRKLDQATGKRSRKDIPQLSVDYEKAQAQDIFFLSRMKRDPDQSLQQAVHALDAFYFASKLRHACAILNRQNIVQSTFSLPFMPEILGILDKAPDLISHPAIALYHCIYFTLTEPAHEAHFQKLTALLEIHADDFDKEERTELYGYAQNYCTKKINQGNALYLRAYFSLDQEMLKGGLLLHEGIMDHRKYKNMVTVAIRLAEFAWVENFLETYRSHLTVPYQEVGYLYNRAAYLHAIGDFSGAKRLLWRVDAKDVYYQLGTRALLLKIYFEEHDPEGLEAQIRVFKSFLGRNKKMSPYQVRSNRALIRYTQRLHKLREKRPALSTKVFRKELEKIDQDITQNPQTANINWLKTQIERMKEV
ncbi:MAG: hypothetical protein AAFQ83_09055 [Bacteroidota bacterium]